LTGIVSVLLETGMEIGDAAFVAARVNRLAGHYARPTLATQAIDIIEHIPRALREILGARLSSRNTVEKVIHEDHIMKKQEGIKII
jgi:chorismate mutase